MNFINRLFRGGDECDVRFIENPQLIAAMEAIAKNDDLDTRRRLYTVLLDSTLVVPTPELPDPWANRGNHIADGKVTMFNSIQ